VLIIGDDDPPGRVPAEVLAVAGFAVVAHVNVDAVASAAALRPDLVVLDIARPGPHTPTVIGDLTGRGIAPVLLLVAAAHAGLIEAGEKAGAAACVVVPFSPPGLLATIELVLARHAHPHTGCPEAALVTRRLQDRNLVERAKGLLICQQEMTEAAAHRWLQHTAMHRRVTLTRVATAVIERWSNDRRPVTSSGVTARDETPGARPIGHSPQRAAWCDRASIRQPPTVPG
jgi:response regulator NasT